jgi:hypothetical protein
MTSPTVRLTVLAFAIVSGAAAHSAQDGEWLLRASWSGTAANTFATGTPDHPGHVQADADGTGFYRLDRVPDGMSAIRARLDVTQRPARWLQIAYEIRGDDTGGWVSGLGYRVLGADGKTVLETSYDYPPCPRLPQTWSSCKAFAHVVDGAHTLEVFVNSLRGAAVDVRTVEVTAVAPESVQPTAAAVADMNHAFDWIRSNYFLADRVDWAQAGSRCEPATFPRDHEPTVPFVRCLLLHLPENAHSSVSRKPASSARPAPVHEIRRLESGTGYAKLATAAVDPGPESDAYAAAASRAITALQAQGVTNWIVDLRGNGGGTVYPMLVAIASLIGPQRRPLAYWEQSGGRKIPVELTARGAEEGGKVQVAVSGLKLPKPPARVVVLVDKGCLSSCEVLATMLTSQKNVSLLGQPTGGLNTSNDELTLRPPFRLMLTTAYVLDASGKRRYPNVVPATTHAGDEASWLAAAESLLAR